MLGAVEDFICERLRSVHVVDREAAGFAHGFVTLEPDTEVLYKTTALYAPAHDRGLAWDDPDIGVKWPLPAGGPILSDKDKRWPRLKDAPDLFA